MMIDNFPHSVIVASQRLRIHVIIKMQIVMCYLKLLYSDI